MKITLYHGTTVDSARRIMKEGFVPDKKYNWNVTSKKGYIYLSKAYAPFYAMTAKSKSHQRAIIKVEVDVNKLYPEDDFIMRALGKPVYTQEDIDNINLEDYKQYYKESLKHMGNACAKPKDIKIIGIGKFDSDGLIMVCDPVISPMNYMILGPYYEALTEWLYEGKKPLNFPPAHSWLMKGGK